MKKSGWVIGGIQRVSSGEPKPSFFQVISDRSHDTLQSIIRANVLPGTIIVTDFWKAYQGLEKAGYVHAIINHAERFADDGGGIYTQTIEGASPQIRRFALPAHGCYTTDIEFYIAQFLFRKKFAGNFINILKSFGELDPQEVILMLNDRKKLIHEEKKLIRKAKKIAEKERKNKKKRISKRTRGIHQEELNLILPDDAKSALKASVYIQPRPPSSPKHSDYYYRVRGLQSDIISSPRKEQ